ncbi:RICIN domain-containing protein, partial [Streptomyces sp. TRM76130]|nr:RICIN domain-containing protein [Streptomyces sp. TRM76130]
APRPSGRPSRGLLAGAAIAGALLIGVPFLVAGVLDRSGSDGGAPTDEVANAGTTLGDVAGGSATGAYDSAAPAPSSASPSPSGGKGGGADSGDTSRASAAAAAGSGAVAQDTEETAKATKEATSGKSSAPKDTPAKSTVTATVTAAPGATLYSHASNRCIEMASHKGSDGSPLQIADCNGKDYQKWDFRSDGTIRSMGLCMDVAWGSHDNGAVIQIAWCSGNPAQQFVLNGSNDLVNPQSGKCVDVQDARTAAGTPLQLWDC